MRIDILGIGIDSLNMEQTVATITRYVEEGIPRRVITANPEMVYHAGHDPKLQTLLNRADLLTADGEGIVWASRLLGAPLPARVTGIDLLNALMPIANLRRWRVYLLGSAPGVAELTAKKLKVQFADISLEQSHGYFQTVDEEQAVLAKIKQFAPHLLLVGLGAGRQELWIAEHQGALQVPVSIGVGGSFDVLSGNIKRAPAWVRRTKLEWLYRLLRQPWRIRRQLVLPKFAWQVIKQKYS